MKYWTPQEWISWYEKKTKDTFTVPDKYMMTYHPQRGIMTFFLDNEAKMIIVGTVVGDGHFWHDVAEIIARANGMRCLATICTRNVEAYIRFWGYKIIKQWDVDGQKRFLGKTPAGYYGTSTYRGKDNKTGVDTYWIIEYLVKGEKPKL